MALSHKFLEERKLSWTYKRGNTAQDLVLTDFPEVWHHDCTAVCCEDAAPLPEGSLGYVLLCVTLAAAKDPGVSHLTYAGIPAAATG